MEHMSSTVSQLPAIVYLDQNKWIELAKALFRPDASPEAKELTLRLRLAVRDGRVRLPVSEIHIMEAAKIGNREQRLQLANVLAEFSEGWFIAGRRACLKHQIDQALKSIFSLTESGSTFCPLAQDIFWAFGGTELLSPLLGMSEERTNRISAFAGPMDLLLSHLDFTDEGNRRKAVEQMAQSNTELINRIRSRRAHTAGESADMRHRVYSAHLFMDVQDKIVAGVNELGKSIADFRALPDEKIRTVTDLVPAWDVERALAVQIEQQWSREMAGNDVYDIAALTIAIPYCDVVVTEKLWERLWLAVPVRAKYKARVTSSLANALDLVLN